MKTITKTVFLIALLLTGFFPALLQAEEDLSVRIKDVSRFKGEEEYSLLGYGLVIGLSGTGDSDEELIQSTLANVLQNVKVVVDQDSLKGQNCAVVMVTATIRKKSNKGDMINATVNSIGDASSLLGGTLIMTPMFGADSKIWALGQGPLHTGGYKVGGGAEGGSTEQKNHPTASQLANGIKMLRDVGMTVGEDGIVKVCLKHPDHTSASNLAQSVNDIFPGSARALDAATIQVRVPNDYRDELRLSEFLGDLEQVMFKPDQAATIVFDERTGTIVIGKNVQISTAAISHANISIKIKDTINVSQPNSFTDADAVKFNDRETKVDEQKGSLVLLRKTTTVKDLVATLNVLGATSRDVMTILQALEQSGALHAKLIAR